MNNVLLSINASVGKKFQMATYFSKGQLCTKLNYRDVHTLKVRGMKCTFQRVPVKYWVK